MIDRFRIALGNMLLKAANLSFVPPWMATAWTDLAFGSLLREGYKGNSAVWACVRVYARAFPEPEMHVWRQTETGKERLPDHPARLLIARPNPFMGEDELWAFVVTYMAIGGNAYLWKERSRSGAVVALWPMHDGQVSPIPGTTTWISHYLYDNGGGNVVPLPVEDVIHLRWAPDPQNPVRGLAPLVAAARAGASQAPVARLGNHHVAAAVHDHAHRVEEHHAGGDLRPPEAVNVVSLGQRRWAGHGGRRRVCRRERRSTDRADRGTRHAQQDRRGRDGHSRR